MESHGKVNRLPVIRGIYSWRAHNNRWTLDFLLDEACLISWNISFDSFLEVHVKHKNMACIDFSQIFSVVCFVGMGSNDGPGSCPGGENPCFIHNSKEGFTTL
jgi:hypothetical protein